MPGFKHDQMVTIPGLGEVRADYLIGGAALVAAGIYVRHRGLLARLPRTSPAYMSASLGVTLAPSVAGLFSAPNPSLYTISTFDSVPEHTSFWIHKGNREAVAQSFMMGIGIAMLTGSWVGFTIIMSMAAWKVASYQGALDGGLDGPGFSMRDGAKANVMAGG